MEEITDLRRQIQSQKAVDDGQRVGEAVNAEREKNYEENYLKTQLGELKVGLEELKSYIQKQADA